MAQGEHERRSRRVTPELAHDRERWCAANLRQWHTDAEPPWGSAICPLHNDSKASLRINLETGGWLCHGCDQRGVLIELARRANLNQEGLPVLGQPTEKRRGRPERAPIAEYIYRTADGQPVLRVCRYEPKDFRQFRWDEGRWQAGLSGATLRLPYMLDRIAQCPEGATILWCEGEKDVEALWNLNVPATTSPQGAKSLGKIRTCDLEVFAGKKIMVLPDNDQPGRDYAEMVAERLAPIASEVAIVELPNLPPKGDVSDWLVGDPLRGLGAEEKRRSLALACQGAKPWRAKTKIRTIYVGDRDLHDISGQALESLLAWNSPPQLYSDRSGQLVRLQSIDGELRISAVSADGLRGWLSESARWRRERKSEEVAVYPDQAVARDIVLRRATAFPLLEQVVRHPVFDAERRLIAENGYHPDSRLYVDCNFRLPEVPAAPTAKQVSWAREMFLDNLFVDFPFVDAASKCHALCAVILPFVRRLTGPTPLHLIESSQVSNGKTLLASVITIPATGRPATIMSDPGDDEAEWRKKIGATLSKSPSYVLIDNVGNGIESDVLAAVLTAEEYEDRELGTSQLRRWPNRAVWLSTGNNLQLKLDIARRTLWTRLDSREARPWERSGWKHPQLATWASAHRVELIWAALVLCQHWIAQGSPMWKGKLMGSYELHNQVLGGICDTAEIPGFLANYAEQFQRADVVSEEWEAFVAAWADSIFFVKPCSVAELAGMMEEKHLLSSVVRGNGEHARRVSLGRRLTGQIDRIYGRFTIRLHLERDSDGLRKYRLERIYAGETPPSPAPVPVPTQPAEVVPEMMF